MTQSDEKCSTIPFRLNFARIRQLVTKDLYKYWWSVARELLKNAYEAIKDKGATGDDKIEITIDAENATFTVEDTGTGLTYQQARDKYSVFGETSKSPLSHLGIGGKAPFRWADAFVIQSRSESDGLLNFTVNDVGVTLRGSKDDLPPLDHNGLRVIVPFNPEENEVKPDTLAVKVRETAMFLPVLVYLDDNIEGTMKRDMISMHNVEELLSSHRAMDSGELQTFKGEKWTVLIRLASNDRFIVPSMRTVRLLVNYMPVELPREYMFFPLSQSAVVHLEDADSITLTPDREGLVVDTKTYNFIMDLQRKTEYPLIQTKLRALLPTTLDLHEVRAWSRNAWQVDTLEQLLDKRGYFWSMLNTDKGLVGYFKELTGCSETLLGILHYMASTEATVYHVGARGGKDALLREVAQPSNKRKILSCLTETAGKRIYYVLEADAVKTQSRRVIPENSVLLVIGNTHSADEEDWELASQLGFLTYVSELKNTSIEQSRVKVFCRNGEDVRSEMTEIENLRRAVLVPTTELADEMVRAELLYYRDLGSDAATRTYAVEPTLNKKRKNYNLLKWVDTINEEGPAGTRLNTYASGLASICVVFGDRSMTIEQVVEENNQHSSGQGISYVLFPMPLSAAPYVPSILRLSNADSDDEKTTREEAFVKLVFTTRDKDLPWVLQYIVLASNYRQEYTKASTILSLTSLRREVLRAVIRSAESDQRGGTRLSLGAASDNYVLSETWEDGKATISDKLPLTLFFRVVNVLSGSNERVVRLIRLALQNMWANDKEKVEKLLTAAEAVTEMK